MIGDTHSDGTVTWKEDFLMGISKLPLVVGYNHKETYQTSGSFTAPITGLYRITLQGAGGGGAGAGTANDSSSYHNSGGGGAGGGGQIVYAELTAGTSYSFTIGAGGTGGAAGSSSISNNGGNGTSGGDTAITIGADTYTAIGGDGGNNSITAGRGGAGGFYKINDTLYTDKWRGASGQAGSLGSSHVPYASGGRGCFGGGNGGSGGEINWQGTYKAGGVGGDGYIKFEWFDPADAFPSLYPSE